MSEIGDAGSPEPISGALAISRDGPRTYVMADSAAAANNMTGEFVELALFSLRNRFVAQHFDTHGEVMQSGALTGEHEIVEAATIRMTRKTSVDIGLLLIAHAFRNDPSLKAELTQRFQAATGA